MSPLLYSPRVRSTFHDIAVSHEGRIVNIHCSKYLKEHVCFFIPQSRGLIQLFCRNFGLNNDMAPHNCFKIFAKIIWLTLCTQRRKIITVPLNILSSVAWWGQSLYGPRVCCMLHDIADTHAVPGNVLYRCFDEPNHFTVPRPVVYLTISLSLHAVPGTAL